AAIVLLILTAFHPFAIEEQKPGPLTDQELEDLSLEVSEAPGYFDTDNLISNEISYVHVIPRLKEVTQEGQAYLGVGPDQNFTYIVHVRPAFSMIIDLRRDNLLQHLYFKQIIEASANRWQYLSYLFGKKFPNGFRPDPSADGTALVEYFRGFSSDRDLFEMNFLKIWSAIRRRFPRLIPDEDRTTFHEIALAFFEENLQLRFRGHGRPPRAYYPTYEQLITEKDHAGEVKHYLNSQTGFQFLKRMQSENRIVPIIGDFAGHKAVRKIGDYLRNQGYVVSAFYLSNVEFYLFQKGTFPVFLENLSHLPMDRTSVVIRSYFNYRRSHPETRSGYSATSILQRLETFLTLHQEKPYRDYWDLVTRDYIPAR
ncbi:hypothetical protein MYX82_04685, partial [Acidobacteria bacterium AH-259-D05]|nr:hypothetical protein [Acidobacteria bacterium AH-259-D05]